MSRAYYIKHKPSGMFLFSTNSSTAQYTPNLIYTEYEISLYKNTKLYLLALADQVKFICPLVLRIGNSEYVKPKQKDFIFIPASINILMC